ncbi:MAG: DUF554 domain-containing protein [Bacillota bacterium]|jgi:uncharacterized membrane protein YqgA involved in biofilm formation
MGTVVNALAIFAGGLLGWWAGSLLSERLKGTLVSALGIVVLALGVEMIMDWGPHVLPVILSVVMGGIIGEALDLEGRLQSLGDKIQASLGKRVKGSLASGFVYTTLIYCVGPMAILGALQGGLEGEHGILYAKSAIDGITAIAFASTLGPGVILSGISVLLYQGLLALGSQLLAEAVGMASAQLTATGAILIMGIGIKILGLKEIRVANLLPALPLVVLLAWGVQWASGL